VTLSPFFIAMHLPKLPTIFVKDGIERKAYFTVEARELKAAGWVEKGEEVKKAPEKKVVAKAEAPAIKEFTETPKRTVTKKEVTE
jgi:hypothetical protein